MSQPRSIPLAALALVLTFVGSARPAQNAQTRKLNEDFQAAVAQYDAGHFAEATVQLEKLLPSAPQSFEIHELLGLVYSAQQLDEKANPHFEKAVRLNPGSAAAHANFAINLVRLGRLELAAAQFRKAVALDPGNFDANHNLGELYVRSGKLAQAVPYLEKAQQIDSGSYDNGYDLALAYLLTGRLDNARILVQQLLRRKNAAELHNLLAEIEEKDGKFIAAVNEYEEAAHMEPSESNLFDWGSELLLHRTLDPAIEVLQQAVERYPQSQRLRIALGAAFYSRGNYDEAVRSLLKAADLNPSDPRAYPFLAHAYDSSPGQADDVIACFRRFLDLQPRNAQAHYFYAMSLWKGKRAQDAAIDLAQVESQLKSAVALDQKLAEAHLQLGNLYSDQKRFQDSIPEYRQAIALNSDLADAHYRLGQAYVRTGATDLAQQQFAIYQKLRAQQLAAIDKQRADIRQFVYAAKDSPAKPQ